jgi:hypothetical protein
MYTKYDGKHEGNEPFLGISIDGSIILNYVLKKQDICDVDWIHVSGYGPVEGFCKHTDYVLDSLRGRELLD